MLKRVAAAAALFLSLNCCARTQPSNDTVFVSNEAGNVTMVDGATGRIEGKLATGARPRGMAFSPDGKTFYVAASDAGRIEAWDVHSHDRVAMYMPAAIPSASPSAPTDRRSTSPAKIIAPSPSSTSEPARSPAR